MNDPLISSAKVLTITVWAVATLLIGAGWLIALHDPEDWPWCLMLSVTGLATVGVAMVLQIRCYVLRLVALIRATSGLEGRGGGQGGQGGELHTIT